MKPYEKMGKKRMVKLCPGEGTKGVGPEGRTRLSALSSRWE